MAIIQKLIRLVGSKGSQEEVAIFDSGSTYSCIQPELADKLGTVEPLPEPMDFGTAKDGETLTATKRVSLNFYLDGYRFSDEFMLIPDLSEPAIIGAATLQKWRMKLDFEADEVIIDPRVTHLRLPIFDLRIENHHLCLLSPLRYFSGSLSKATLQPGAQK